MNDAELEAQIRARDAEVIFFGPGVLLGCQGDRRTLLRLLDEARAELAEESHQFQNFHGLLCERFGYFHDPVDWRRDQLSLIEHIAALIAKPSET